MKKEVKKSSEGVDLLHTIIAIKSSFPDSRIILCQLISRLFEMTLKEGDTVPSVTFKARVRDEKIGGDNPFDWKDVTSDDLFKGKRVAIFSLPGGK